MTPDARLAASGARWQHPPMIATRRSAEAGHRRKFLAVVDATPECDRAVYYAARRAEHTGGVLVLLYVIEPAQFSSFLGVENIMRAEAMDAAEETLAKFVARVRSIPAADPELAIREGMQTDEILKLINDDPDIAVLVLATGTGSEGPGPLVSSIAKAGSTFPIPVTIVPGTLSDGDIAAVS